MVAAGADRGPTRPRYRTTGIQQRDAEHIESCLPPPLCDYCNYLPSALLEITRKRISSRMQTHNLPRRARFRERCRQLLPWDYFRFARNPPGIEATSEWSFQARASELSGVCRSASVRLISERVVQ